MDISELVDKIWFWVMDFDNTLARTFDPSPKQIDVHSGYNLAIKFLFGKATLGEDPLAQIGGLQNRAPSEVIDALFKLMPDLKGQSKDVFDRFKDILNAYVPAGKGTPLIWDETQPNWDPLRLISELLVRAKLLFLINEIGPAWPLPCNGFKEFLQDFPKLKERSKRILQLAILSSGHDEFIKKAFLIWGLPCPELMITDDDLRVLHFPNEPKKTVKPSSYLLDLVHLQWLMQQGLKPETINLNQFLAMARKQTIYFGDDPIKDGQLAQNAGIPFGWFNPNGKSAQNLGEYDFIFGDWRQVPGILGLA